MSTETAIKRHVAHSAHLKYMAIQDLMSVYDLLSWSEIGKIINRCKGYLPANMTDMGKGTL